MQSLSETMTNPLDLQNFDKFVCNNKKTGLSVDEYITFQSNQVNMLCPYFGSVVGTLMLTNHRLLFLSLDENISQYIPYGVISKLEKYGNQSTLGKNAYGLEIICKDMRRFKFSFMPEKHSRREFFELLHKHAFPISNNSALWAFNHRYNFNVDGWTVYNPRCEYLRMGLPNENWKITGINKDYSLCDTYPKLLCVPRQASEELLRKVATFRSRGRIPVLSWKNHNNHSYIKDVQNFPSLSLGAQNEPDNLQSLDNCISEACILRGAQPLNGFSGATSSNDKTYIRMIIETNSHFSQKLAIFDARPKINAVANKAKGGGFESEDEYKDIELIFLDIANIHVMRESYKKLAKECYPFVDELHWLTKLESTHWLDHIKAVLFGALRIVDKVDNQQSSAFIHCSDGWDRTSQLTSLAMIMLDPYYRTIEGFEVLIEKEWLSFGHKFAQRIGHGYDNYGTRKYSSNSHKTLESDEHLNKTLKISTNHNSPSFQSSFQTSNSVKPPSTATNLQTKHPLRQNSLTSQRSHISLKSYDFQHKDNKYKKPKFKPSEVSPIFVQFMDCVYQLTRQFPAAFEFDEYLLIKIIDNLYTCVYGTFLGNCEHERDMLRLSETTESLWSEINSNLQDYLNPYYQVPPPSLNPANAVLYPIVTIRHLEFWEGLYLRWNPYSRYQKPSLAVKNEQVLLLKQQIQKDLQALTLINPGQPLKYGPCSQIDSASDGCQSHSFQNSTSSQSFIVDDQKLSEKETFDKTD